MRSKQGCSGGGGGIRCKGACSGGGGGAAVRCRPFPPAFFSPAFFSPAFSLPGSLSTSAPHTHARAPPASFFLPPEHSTCASHMHTRRVQPFSLSRQHSTCASHTQASASPPASSLGLPPRRPRRLFAHTSVCVDAVWLSCVWAQRASHAAAGGPGSHTHRPFAHVFPSRHTSRAAFFPRLFSSRGGLAVLRVGAARRRSGGGVTTFGRRPFGHTSPVAFAHTSFCPVTAFVCRRPSFATSSGERSGRRAGAAVAGVLRLHPFGHTSPAAFVCSHIFVRSHSPAVSLLPDAVWLSCGWAQRAGDVMGAAQILGRSPASIRRSPCRRPGPWCLRTAAPSAP